MNRTCVACLMFFALNAAVQGDVNIWAAGMGGNWSESAHWSDGIPDSADEVRIGANSAVTNNSAAFAGSVYVSSSRESQTASLTFEVGADLVASDVLQIAESSSDFAVVNMNGGRVYFGQRVLDGPVGCSVGLNISDGLFEVRGVVFDGGGRVSLSGGELRIFGTNNSQLQLTNGSSLNISGNGVLVWAFGNKVAAISNLVAAGSITWSDPGTTMLYNTWDQRWVNDEGDVLYAYNDGGVVYAWTVMPNIAGTLTIDCASAQFPPLVQKFHGGSFFIRDDNDVIDWIDRDGTLQCPIYRANMRDCRENYAANKTGGAYIGNDPAVASNPRGLLYPDGTNVMPNFDLSLDALRAQVAGHEMINYIRWDGVPYMATLAEDGLFRSPSYQGGKDPAGDSSPPPYAEDRLKFARAIGDFAAHLNENESEFRPTIWSFWQEPDHTLGDPSVPYGVVGMDLTEEEKRQNVRMLVRDIYRHLAHEVRAADPDYMVSGIAQNSSAAEWDETNYDPDGPRIGGGRLGHTIDEWLIQEELHNETYPLDYFSLQLYQGDDMEEFHIPNSRYAMKNLISLLHPAQSNRFDRTPIFITEYNYVKQDDEWTSEVKYNLDDAKFREVTENWIYILSQPDIAYVTLQDIPHAFPDYRSRRWLEAYADMPELRVEVDETMHLNALASYDTEFGLYAMLWNSSGTATTHVIQVDNCGFDPADAVFFSCSLDTSDNGIWQAKDTMLVDTNSWLLEVAANEIVFMANTGDPVYVPGDRIRSRKVLVANYGSHNVLVPRIDAQETDQFGRLVPPRPKGMGHYDQIDGRLVVGVEDASGVGLAGVVLRDVTDDYLLRLDLDSLGLAAGAGTLRLRVDYLDGETALKSVLVNEPDLNGGTSFEGLSWFEPADALVSYDWSFYKGGSVLLPLGSWKPEGWMTADSARRRVRISLLLADVENDATLIASLSDQSSYVGAEPGCSADGRAVLSWPESNRSSYSIWATTNLQEQFLLLESGLTGHVYTGSVPNPAVFYKMTVDE